MCVCMYTYIYIYIYITENGNAWSSTGPDVNRRLWRSPRAVFARQLPNGVKTNGVFVEAPQYPMTYLRAFSNTIDTWTNGHIAGLYVLRKHRIGPCVRSSEVLE